MWRKLHQLIQRSTCYQQFPGNTMSNRKYQEVRKVVYNMHIKVLYIILRCFKKKKKKLPDLIFRRDWLYNWKILWIKYFKSYGKRQNCHFRPRWTFSAGKNSKLQYWRRCSSSTLNIAELEILESSVLRDLSESMQHCLR